MRARLRSAAIVLGCGTALFAAAFAAGVTVRGGDAPPPPTPAAAVRRGPTVAGLAPATALPALRAPARRVQAVARRRAVHRLPGGQARSGVIVADAGEPSASRPVASGRLVVASRPAPAPVPSVPVRHTVPAARPTPAAPAPAAPPPPASSSRPPAPSPAGSSGVTFFSDGG
jgi:hypothetical protein